MSELELELVGVDDEDQPVTEQVVKYLCFHMGEELYGFELESVQEIIRDLVITRVPNTQPWIVGVGNLRGRVTPIIDLRRRVGSSEQDTQMRWVVVLEVIRDNQTVAVGAVVDNLPEVVTLEQEQIQSRQDQDATSNYVVGLGKTGEKVVLILDPLRLVFDVDPCEGSEE